MRTRLPSSHPQPVSASQPVRPVTTSALAVPLSVGLILAVGPLVSTCASPGIADDPASWVGVYTLISVDGREVPARVVQNGVTLEVRAGTFTLAADGNCTSRTVFVPPSGGEVAREVGATYVKDGATLTMHWENAGTTVGTLEGDLFTMDNAGMVFVYRRRP